jgi:hypothetical protein
MITLEFIGKKITTQTTQTPQIIIIMIIIIIIIIMKVKIGKERMIKNLSHKMIVVVMMKRRRKTKTKVRITIQRMMKVILFNRKYLTSTTQSSLFSTKDKKEQ